MKEMSTRSPKKAPSEHVKSRRTFLKVTGLGTAGFMIGLGLADQNDGVFAAEEREAGKSVFNPFVRVSADDTVTVVVNKLDMGQGIIAGFATIVAEEMDADWDQMDWEFAPVDVETYKDSTGVQATGGSRSIRLEWNRLRQMAASARFMLVQAAATVWGVPATEISVSKGMLSHASGKKGTFGEFAAAASEITPPAQPSLKSAADYKLIGTRLKRPDTDEKTDGTATYTMDVSLPGMLHAAIAHAPKFGGKVKSFDDKAARAIDGVEDVVQIESGVAVVAKRYYIAKKAVEALDIEWDFSSAETRSTDQLFAGFRAMAKEAGTVARNDGDVEAAFANADKVIETEYELPFLAHAALEPMNAVVDLREDECHVWTGSQAPQGDQLYTAQIVGLPLEKVHVHTLYAGGSFGRRVTITGDYNKDAAMVAKAIGGRAPVKLQWARENDMKGGKYRSMSFVKMRGGLDKEGNLIAWHTTLVTPAYAKGTAFESRFIHNGIDHPTVEGADINPYEVPNLKLETHHPETAVTMSHWRSVGHSQNGFTMEVFVDEMALAAGKDPVEFRRNLLANHPRHLAVLNKAVAEAGPVPKGRGKARGVAMHESFYSYVAEVADVTLKDDGTYSVDKVVCAVDCGLAINPDNIKAQMEGSIAMGLGAAMREQITLTDGEVDQSNFYDYFPLRMSDMPNIDVHIIPSTEAPTGVGEPGLPPIAPAVANALRAAGAKPIRKLPIGDRVEV